MGDMSFSDRMRASAVAALAVVALGHPGMAHADHPAAEVRETAEGYEIDIAPGETLPLEPNGETIAGFNIREGEDSTLPAGWSVLTGTNGLRITAPATAADGDFTTVEAVRANGDTELLRVVVDRDEPETLTSSASSTSWVSELIGKVATFFAV